jgi:hypothetical protein
MTAPSETSAILHGYGGYSIILDHSVPVVTVNPEIVVYSAKEDPTDPAHFQFFYDLESERVHIDCWLEYGTVRMDSTIQPRPATTLSTAPAG